MNSEKVSALASVRRHVVLTIALVAVGIAGGVGGVLLHPAVYTAEARLAVGGSSGLAAEAVPGYALASQQLAANYARYVNNAQGESDLEKQLGVPAGRIRQVSASPIPESNVVRIEVTSQMARTASDAASAVANSLMQQVNDTSANRAAADATLSAFTKISAQVAAAQQASDLAKAALNRAAGEPGADLAQLSQQAAATASQLAILQVQQDALGEKYRQQVSSLNQGAANLVVIENAVVTGDDRASQMGQFGLAGLVGGFLLALLLSVLLERRRSASSDSQEAFPPVLTSAAVPAVRPLAPQVATAGADRVD
jgi:capsular polysaccharide biosynthesis protein